MGANGPKGNDFTIVLEVGRSYLDYTCLLHETRLSTNVTLKSGNKICF